MENYKTEIIKTVKDNIECFGLRLYEDGFNDICLADLSTDLARILRFKLLLDECHPETKIIPELLEDYIF